MRDKVNYSPLRAILKDIGDWPMLTNKWNKETFNWEDSVSKITTLIDSNVIKYEAMKVSLPPLLNVNVIPHLKNNSQMIIQVNFAFKNEL